MARLNDATRELILADFHTGYFSQRKLAEKYEVSTATINKLTKGLEPKHLDKVNAILSARTGLAEESEQEVNAVHSVVDERIRHIAFFNDSALRNQYFANKQLKEDLKLSELESHSRLTAKNKETVLGKDIKDNDATKDNDIVIEIK